MSIRVPIKGDKVRYGNRNATVTSVYFNQKANRICEIEYDNFNQGMWYDEVLSDSLEFQDDPPSLTKGLRKLVDTNKQCPICESKWIVTKSVVGNSYWKDCGKCNKTKEQIMKEN